MRILWFLIPALVVASMLQGRITIDCEQDQPSATVQPAVSAPATASCCMADRLAKPAPMPCNARAPKPACRVCCTVCEPRNLAPLPLPLVITGITLWPNLDPSYPIMTGGDAAPHIARYQVPPRPPDDATAHRAHLCCWLT
ncbi:MAG: hypothetical protein KDA20_11325 [Phycisphaerales bacterium]|nr:hypothetical protein [Phycisphaerales bacterium]